MNPFGTRPTEKEGPVAVPLKSSWMSTAEYDPDEKSLEITLDDGHSYTYQGVPSQVYEALIAAPSAGSYFRRFIRDNYPET